MNFSLNFPLFTIVLSLTFSVASALLPRKAARILSIVLGSIAAAASAAVLLYTASTGESYCYQMGHFPHPFGNELKIGALEALFSLAFALVMLSCVIGGKKQLRADLAEKTSNLYYAMIDLIEAALLVLVYTNDLFTGYVFIEICTLASCGILLIRQVGRTTLASVRYMIFSLVGSGLFLFGVILLYQITGHLLMPNLKESIAALWESGTYRVPLLAAMILTLTGLAIKSGLFPFHFWMPDTYGYATPASSGVLSGLISKGYIFLLLKLVFDVYGAGVFYQSGLQNVFYVLGFAGMIVGSVSAMRENDIFRMIAYSSAAQIGYIYLGIGISPAFGVCAALFHILTHAVTKPLLFLSAAQLCETVGGKKQFKELQGTAHFNKIAGFAFTVGALSMIGIPPTMGFISKYLFAVSAFHSDFKMIPTLIVLAISTVLNTVYFARTLIRIYNRPEQTYPGRISLSQQRPFAFSAFFLIAINLAAGIASQPLVNLLDQSLNLF